MPLRLPWRCTEYGGLTCSLLLHSLPWRNSLNGVAHIAWKQVPGWFHSLGFFREASFPLFGFSTNAWEHHVIIMPVASRNRSIGRATHKVFVALIHCSSCWTTTDVPLDYIEGGFSEGGLVGFCCSLRFLRFEGLRPDRSLKWHPVGWGEKGIMSLSQCIVYFAVHL